MRKSLNRFDPNVFFSPAPPRRPLSAPPGALLAPPKKGLPAPETTNNKNKRRKVAIGSTGMLVTVSC